MNEDFNDNMEEKEKQRLISKEEKKFNHSSKRFYNLLIEIFNLPLQKQILIFFFMIYVLYLMFIILMKHSKLDNLNIEIADMTYYSVVGKEYFDKIGDSYKTIHSVGFDSNMTHLTKGINFLNIYTRELNRLNLTYYDSDPKKDFIYNWESLNSLQNLYEEKDFSNKRFYYSLKGCFKENQFSKYDPIKTSEENRLIYKGYNNNLLFPMLFVLIPNIIDSASDHKLRLETIHFISSTFEKNPYSQNYECRKNFTTDYFTFPKYDQSQENFVLMDEVIDPHSSCEKYILGDNEIRKNLNYYYVVEKNFTNSDKNNRKILNRFQKLENNQKRSNFFSYLSMQKISKSASTKDVVSFVFNFYDNLVNYNHHGDIFNHFSIFYPRDNLIENESGTFPNNDRLDPNLSYNIINERRMVVTIPPFLENLYIYGYNVTKYFKEYYDDDHSIVNTNDIFAYGNNSKILNTNFNNDAKIFNLIAFLAKQYREINSGMDNTCENYKYDLEDFGYDYPEHTCFKNLCHFNSCIGTEPFFDPQDYLHKFLDCRCLPLFCKNYLKNKIDKNISIVENSLNNNNQKITKEQWNIYDLYKKFNETISYNSFNLDFFKNNSTKTSLKCQINFKRKTWIEIKSVIDAKINPNSYFHLQMKISEKPFTTDGIYVISYLISLDEIIYDLYINFFKEIKDLNFRIFISYSVIIVLFSFVSLRKFFNNLNDFKERIIELNENRILKMINKQNEKKNNARLKKMISNDYGKINFFHIYLIFL